MLAGLSGTAHLVQMFDSTVIRAHAPSLEPEGHSGAFCQSPVSWSCPHRADDGQAETVQAHGPRCEKTDRNFRSIVAIAATFVLLKSVHTVYPEITTTPDKSRTNSDYIISSKTVSVSRILPISLIYRWP